MTIYEFWLNDLFRFKLSFDGDIVLNLNSFCKTVTSNKETLIRLGPRGATRSAGHILPDDVNVTLITPFLK